MFREGLPARKADFHADSSLDDFAGRDLSLETMERDSVQGSFPNGFCQYGVHYLWF
jgi:hypothetical protein